MNMLKLPTENTVSRALTYIAETDSLHAIAKAEVERLKRDENVIYAGLFIQVRNDLIGKEKPTEKLISSHIYSHQTYRQWLDDYEDTIAVFTMLNNKRQKAFTAIDVWRSLNSQKNRATIA